MKYNFDEIIDRAHNPYSFSAKWGDWVNRDLKTTEIPDDAICLQLADMDIRVAPEIIEDLHKLVDHGIFGYSTITPAYRKAVASWFERRQNWKFSPDNVYYEPGTHDAISNILAKITKPGEGVIVLTPCYGYHMDINANNLKFVPVFMNNNNNYYTIDFDAFEKACEDENNTVFILCHPHNPTGRVFTKEELDKMTEICRRNHVVMISDEVHSDILRKGVEFHPLMEIEGPQGIISCTAVNKTFNLAGLAMTNVIVEDEELREKVFPKFSMVSPFGLQAVISAYTKCDQWVDELDAYFDESLTYFVDFMNEKLPKAKVIKPEGGYIVWVDFSGYGLSDEELYEKFRNQHIVVQGGKNFDAPEGDQWVRLCLASPISVIKDACQRFYKEFGE